MDPLDPLTEIINSGQAFSPFIALERLLWLMIGVFFLGAISSSIKTGMKDHRWFSNKSFLINIKGIKRNQKITKNKSLNDKSN